MREQKGVKKNLIEIYANRKPQSTIQIFSNILIIINYLGNLAVSQRFLIAKTHKLIAVINLCRLNMYANKSPKTNKKQNYHISVKMVKIRSDNQDK